MPRALAAVLVLVLAGCVQPPAGEAAPEAAPPADRFTVAPAVRTPFTMSDGVVLDAVAWRPEGAGVTPVILHALPYAGVCTWAAPDAPYPKPCAPELGDPFWLDEYNGLPRALVESGYTVVDVSVRGTGASGGCFTLYGPQERRDLGEVLDRLGEVEWAGEVGMMGLSYMALTPLEAMAERPGRVKAVVIGGVGFDEYVFTFTPQGASSAGMQVFWGAWLSSVIGPPATSPRGMDAFRQRACPELATLALTPPRAHATDERPRTFFEERRYLDTLRGLDTGILVVQGVLDRAGGQQVEPLWPALDGTPRALVLGRWEHRFPDDALLEGSGLGWPGLPLAWFDHFLREGPAPDALGRVHVQVENEGWRAHDAWPPSAAYEALYAGDTLAREPAPGARTFRLAPQARACGDAPQTWLVALSEPLAAPASIVGNPMAWLELTSTSPSATVGVDLWDVPGENVCEGSLISYGAADLRFRDDPFQGRDVPVGETLGTRVDMHAAAWRVPAGHRLALTLSTAGEHGASGRPGAGALSVSGASHLLLPGAEGVGAQPPSMAYPPRPFGVTQAEN